MKCGPRFALPGVFVVESIMPKGWIVDNLEDVPSLLQGVFGNTAVIRSKALVVARIQGHTFG